MGNIMVEEMYKQRKDFFELSLLTNEDGLKKKITDEQIHRPGLALAGFTDRFAYQRMQILGETELTYLKSLDSEKRKELIEKMLGFDLPCIIVAKNITPPRELLDLANRKKIAIFQSRLSTAELTNRLSTYLSNVFAPSITLHGTLVDVYGVGLLYTGKSGIGKSECALDLVERGHRLVADDIIKVIKKAPEVIVGTGSEFLGHHMEVRGIGIIDMEKLFGIRAIRLQKRIEVEVRLVWWEDEAEYDRLGVEDKITTILGVEIPMIILPVSPGKNITVISEVIAMNHMLKVYGEHPARAFARKLDEEIYRKTSIRDYLESDVE